MIRSMSLMAAALAAVFALGHTDTAQAMPVADLGAAVDSPVATVQWRQHGGWGGRGGAWGGRGGAWAGRGVGPGRGVWAGRGGAWAGRGAWRGGWAGRPYGYGGYRPGWRGYRYGAPAYGYGYPAYGYGYPAYGYGYGAPYGGYGYGYGYPAYDPGAAVAAGIIGLATGAIVRGALSGQQRAYRGSRSASSYCARRYKSYDPSSRTFLGRDGRRHRCG